MKISLAFILILLLAGCGQLSRATAIWTGYDVQCVDGVRYIQFSSGVTVKYDTNGKIETCK